MTYKKHLLRNASDILSSSTAVTEDLRPTATATVAEVWDHFYGRRSYL